MKKTFLVLSLIVSLLLQPFFSLTFALAPVQEVPEVCHGATPRLQLYFDFQAEMAQTLL